MDASGEGGGDAGGGPTGQNSGCGCRTAQEKEDGPSSTLLAFGGIGLVGAMRLRRRKKDPKN
jgi:MYXO-CTERM domain-containing protein